MGTAPAVTSATEKKTPAASAAPAIANPLESDFDLLSLSQQSGQPQTVPTKPSIANDLLGLGDGSTDNNSEFDEFVGAQKTNTCCVSFCSSGKSTTAVSRKFHDWK